MPTRPDRLREASYFIRFSLVGASGFAIDVSAFFGLRELGLERGLAAALAIWLAMSSNYCWNRLWTFSDREKQGFWRQYIAFCLSCLLGAVVNWSTRILLWLLFPTVFGNYELAAIAAGVAMGMGANFLLCRFLVFRGVKHIPKLEPHRSLTPSVVTPDDGVTLRSDRESVLSTSG